MHGRQRRNRRAKTWKGEGVLGHFKVHLPTVFP